MKTYFKFLANAVFRRATLWIIGIIYMIVIIALMVIIPIIANVFYLIMYSLTFAFVQVIFLYITAIFSALIAVYVFKIFSDDGTELLLSSKPLSRIKMVTVKFAIFLIVSLFFAFFSSLAVFFVFLLPNIVYTTIFSLWLSIIVGNIICMLFFGSISVLCCLWFNKIVVIVINVVLCVLMVIYSTVVLSVAPDPASKIKNEQHSVALSVNNINKKNDVVYNTSYNPMSIDFSDPKKLKQFTYDGQINLWNQAVKDHPMGALNAFNMAWGLGSSYQIGLVREIAENYNASSGMGVNTKLVYNIVSKTHPLNLRDPNDSRDNWDNTIEWSDMGNLNLAPYYLSWYKVSRPLLKTLIQDNLKPWSGGLFPTPQEITNFISEYLSVYSSYNVASLGYDQLEDWVGNTYGTTTHKNKWELKNGLTTGRFYKGTVTNANEDRYINYELEPNDDEKDFFNYLIYETFFDSSSALYKNSFTYTNNELNIDSDTWSAKLQYDDQSHKEAKYFVDLYNAFKNKEDIKGHKAWDNLNIKSDFDYSLEVLKFKYYLWNQFNGAYIRNNNDLNNADYKIKNYGSEIIVPYSDFYKLVFIPQFHSTNLQATKGDPDPSIGINIDLLKTVQQFFINGMIPSTINWLSNPSGIARLEQVLPICGIIPADSNPDTSVISDVTPSDPTTKPYLKEFQAYDLQADGTNPGFLTDSSGNNVYGYYCPLEVKLQTLINSNFSLDSSLSYIGKWSEDYKSSLIQSFTNLLSYQVTMYSYDFNNKYQPAYITVYLTLTFIILVIAFKKYSNVDYH